MSTKPVKPVKQELIAVDFDDTGNEMEDDTATQEDSLSSLVDEGAHRLSHDLLTPPSLNPLRDSGREEIEEESYQEGMDPWVECEDFDELIDDETLLMLEGDSDGDSPIPIPDEDDSPIPIPDEGPIPMPDDGPIAISDDDEELPSSSEGFVKTLQEIAEEEEKDVYDPAILGIQSH